MDELLVAHHTASSRGAAAVRSAATGHRADCSKKQQLLSPLSLSFFLWFVLLILLWDSVCVVLLVGAQGAAFCVGRILPFPCPRVIDVLFTRKQMQVLPWTEVIYLLYSSHEFVFVWQWPSHESLCPSHETSAL